MVITRRSVIIISLNRTLFGVKFGLCLWRALRPWVSHIFNLGRHLDTRNRPTQRWVFRARIHPDNLRTGSLLDLLNNNTILLEGELILGFLRFVPALHRVV